MQTNTTKRTKKRLTDADLRKLKILQARKSLPHFVEHIIRDNQGNSVGNAEHMVAWWDHMRYAAEIRKTPLILAPMSFAKTSWMALALPLWLLGQNENFRIMIISAAEKIASERLETIGRYIQQSPEYHEVFPWVQRARHADWNKHRLNVVRRATDGGMTGAVNASVSAYGYTSSEGIGSRTDILLFDDIVDESNSVIAPSKRQVLKNLVETQWITRCDPEPLYDRYGNVLFPGSLILAIGTRYHEEDWYADCINSPSSWCTLVQGVSDDFGHLDCEIIGALTDPPHPLLTRYAGWEPIAA